MAVGCSQHARGCESTPPADRSSSSSLTEVLFGWNSRECCKHWFHARVFVDIDLHCLHAESYSAVSLPTATLIIPSAALGKKKKKLYFWVGRWSEVHSSLCENKRDCHYFILLTLGLLDANKYVFIPTFFMFRVVFYWHGWGLWCICLVKVKRQQHFQVSGFKAWSLKLNFDTKLEPDKEKCDTSEKGSRFCFSVLKHNNPLFQRETVVLEFGSHCLVHINSCGCFSLQMTENVLSCDICPFVSSRLSL